jgi:hypothetical protein
MVGLVNKVDVLLSFSSIPRRVDLPNITHMSALRSDGPMQPSDRKREYGETQHEITSE